MRRLLMAAGICWLVAGQVQAQESKIDLAGKVVNEDNHPVNHVLVVARERDGKTVLTAHTDGLGRFDIWRWPSARCTVQVVPPEKTGLAQALLTNVPAEEDRHFIVVVHKGYHVRGRVVS